MTVYVRLMGGFEDAYPRYEAQGELVSAETILGESFPAYRRTEVINPQVKISGDGSMQVMKGTDQVGFYPAGAWISWRSD